MKKKNIITSHANLEMTREVFAPPPPNANINSPFSSIGEWLSALCKGEQPQKAIDTYSFGIFESQDEWLLFIVGEDYSEPNKIKIGFKPSLMYFRIPEAELKNNTREKLREKIMTQIKRFTETEEFKSSFLAKAFTIEFSGEILWH